MQRPAMSDPKTATVALVSLGCPKNLVDSERMLAALALDGLVVTDNPYGADLALVNTCAFIDLARAESDRHIDLLEALKRQGRLGAVVVAGCMAQRYGRDVLARHPLVDAVVGIGRRDTIARICRRVLARIDRRRPAPGEQAPGRACRPDRCGEAAPAGPLVCVGRLPARPPDDRERLRLTPRHYAYLRITEGCDNRCSYCAIPQIRGPLRSKPIAQVLAEAEELAADGARELILIGQDTTAYGRDFRRPGRRRSQGGPTLGRLLAELRRRALAPWVRLMYAHPASFTDETIEQLAAGPPLVPYVDLPLQHVSDPILASMGRRVTRRQVEGLIERLRRAVPAVALRTSFIVGYPGETEEQFEELLAFVEQVRFDQLGAFLYSAEAGTRSACLAGQVPAQVARRRWDRLMRLAARLARDRARRRVGELLEVLIDGPDRSGRLMARHAGQAPEVDSRVILPAGAARVGQFAKVRITGAQGYDLVGKPE